MIPYADRLRKLSVKTPAAQPAPPVATPAVLDTVARLVADVLALPEERLDCGRSFSELGVNSLLAVRLLDRINRAFHLRLVFVEERVGLRMNHLRRQPTDRQTHAQQLRG